VNKQNDLNINYFKIPTKHSGLHKMLSQATCGPRVWGPRIHSRYLFVTFKHALCRFNHNHVECWRFHQWFHINLPTKKKVLSSNRNLTCT